MERVTVSLQDSHIDQLNAIGRHIGTTNRSKIIQYLIEMGHQVQTMSAAHSLLSQLTGMSSNNEVDPVEKEM